MAQLVCTDCSGYFLDELPFAVLPIASKADAGVTVQPQHIDFGRTKAGSTAREVLYLRSAGMRPMDFSTSCDSPLYSVTPSRGCLRPYEVVRLTVLFTPDDPAPSSASIVIDGGSAPEIRVPVRGTASPPQIGGFQ